MAATWTDPASGVALNILLEELRARSQEAVKCHIGPTAPSAHGDGWLWLDTSGDPFYILRVKSKTAAGATRWVAITSERLAADLDFDSDPAGTKATLYQAKSLRIGNLAAASLPAAGANNQGGTWYRTDDDRIVYVTVDHLRALCSVREGTDLDAVEISLRDATLGATPPTAASKGTSPRWSGWLFDAVGESLVLQVKVPANYRGGADLEIELDCLLNATEVSGDDIDWSGDVEVLTPGTAGDAAGGTSTALAASTTDIGSSNVNEGAFHRCVLTLDHDNGDNPITAGDLIAVEIHRTDMAEVNGVILIAARLRYPMSADPARA